MRSSNLKMLKRDCVAYVMTPIDPNNIEATADEAELSLKHERDQAEPDFFRAPVPGSA